MGVGTLRLKLGEWGGRGGEVFLIDIGALSP